MAKRLHARGASREGNRRLTRLAVSVDTLLRLHLRLPAAEDLRHCLPLAPAGCIAFLQEVVAAAQVADHAVNAADHIDR